MAGELLEAGKDACKKRGNHMTEDKDSLSGQRKIVRFICFFSKEPTKGLSGDAKNPETKTHQKKGEGRGQPWGGRRVED